MRPAGKRQSRKAGNPQAGLTLIETMISLGVLLVVATGILGLGAMALTTTENQGHLLARTAEYAQDKMEQLLALKFCDATSDTTVLPTSASGGQGLAGCSAPLNSNGTGAGGSSNPAAPVAGFVDYLDNSGNLLAATTSGGAPAGWKYERVWQISSANAANTLKQITVTVKVSTGVGSGGILPQSTVTALKAYPF
jgi:hypothetical protein